MTKSAWITIGVASLLGLAASTSAFATPIQVTVQANFVKDPSAASVFGYSDASVPIVFQFTFDSDDASSYPAGTPIALAKGFSSDIQLLGASTITSFSAAIGNQTFTSTDLVHQTLGTSALPYDILLVGTLDEGGLSGVQFGLDSGLGTFDVGITNCAGTNCVVQNIGDAIDYIEFGDASLSDISVTTHLLGEPTAVPEPALTSLLLAGLCGLFAFRRRRPAT